MRSLGLSFSATALPLLAAGFVWACSGNTATSTGGPDASDDSGDDSSVDSSGLPDVGVPPDATTHTCTFSGGTDPVAICVQELALTEQISRAYTKGVGFAPGWSSAPPYAALSGHAWQDDLAAAGALGAYLCSAEAYGSSRSSSIVGTTLGDLKTPLLAELGGSSPPYQSSTDGEIYFRLRWAGMAYSIVDGPTATALAGQAETFGASLLAAVQGVPPSTAPAGDGGDAGATPDDGGDAAVEAGDAGPVTSDAGGGNPGGRVIGTSNPDGSVTYAPAQAVMAAAALLDLAALHASDPDAGVDSGLPPVAASYLAAGRQVLAYVLARGKDPGTGLFFQSLVTSSDPAHDTPATATPSSDAVLSETQAWVIFGLARAQSAVDKLQLPPDAGGLVESYWAAGADLAQAMNTAGLFDGVSPLPSPPPATAPVGAMLEGLVLSSGEKLTNKTTIANAAFLGGYNLVQLGLGATLGYEVGEVRSALTQRLPPSSSLLSVIPDQTAFFAAASQSYGYALAYPEDAGMEAPGARSYRVDAVAAMVEGFTQLWFKAANNPHCAP